MIYLLSAILGVFAFYLFQYFPYLTAVLALAAFYLLAKKKTLLPAAVFLLGALYPLIYGVFSPPPLKRPSTVALKGQFVSAPVKLEGGYSQDFSPAGRGGPGTVAVLSGKPFEVGREYKLLMRLVVPPERQNPGAREREPYAVLKSVSNAGEPSGGVQARMNKLRERLNTFMRENMGVEEAALAMAVTTGARAELGPELREVFRATGTSHLLSISGTHFGLFAFLVFGLTKWLMRRLPAPLLERLTLFLTPSAAAAVVTLPFLLFYLGISGGSVPSVRSFIMVGLFLLGLLIVRGGHWLNFLLLAGLLVLLWEPEAFKGLPFQLSFTAVLFIGFFMKGAGGVGGLFCRVEGPPSGGASAPAWPRRLLTRAFVGPLLVSLSATLGVAPMVAYYFHYFSLISPAANLLVTPLVGFMLVPVSLLGCFLCLLTGSAILAPAMGAVSGASLHLVKWFASLPYASVRVLPFPAALLVFFYLGFVLFWATGRKRFLAVSAAPALAYVALCLAAGTKPSVTFLDAGRADASVIELPDGKVVVVDTGRTGKEVEEFLWHRGLKRIDALVITTPHKDHAGGARRLLRRFQVGEVWDNGRISYPEGFIQKGTKHRRLMRGDVISGLGYRLTVLHPYPGFQTLLRRERSPKNDDPLVLRLDAPGLGSVLFAGEVGAEAVEDVLHVAQARRGALKCDVLKVSSHGLRSPLGRAFAEAASPGYTVLSSDTLGRPLGDALKGHRVLLTGEAGAVKVEVGGNGPRVKTYSDFAVKKARGGRDEAHNLRRLFAVW